MKSWSAHSYTWSLLLTSVSLLGQHTDANASIAAPTCDCLRQQSQSMTSAQSQAMSLASITPVLPVTSTAPKAPQSTRKSTKAEPKPKPPIQKEIG